MLLYPFEEGLYGPVMFAKHGYCHCCKLKVVGQKDQGFFGFTIMELNASHFYRVILGNIETTQFDSLVFKHKYRFKSFQL